jgi:hypothetical protein
MSNFSKFKRSDRIKTKNGSVGTVLNTYRQDGKFMIHVESDSGMRTDYKEEELTFYHEDIESIKSVAPEHIGDKCPICQTPWTITRFGVKNWKDCKPCGKTAEDLLDRNTQHVSKKDATYDMEDYYDTLSAWGSD